MGKKGAFQLTWSTSIMFYDKHLGAVGATRGYKIYAVADGWSGEDILSKGMVETFCKDLKSHVIYVDSLHMTASQVILTKKKKHIWIFYSHHQQ